MGLGKIILKKEIIHLYPKVEQRLYRQGVLDEILSGIDER